MRLLRTIYAIVASLLFTIGFQSCDSLNIEPSKEFERDEFYKDATDVDLAVAGMYTTLREIYNRDMSIWINCGTDEMLYSRNLNTSDGSPMSNFTYSKFDINIRDIWLNSYKSISRANDVIANLESRDSIPGLTREDHLSIIGEALTLRAHNYLNLVRMFEYIPLRLNPYTDIAADPDGLHLPFLSPDSIYDQIIKDLNQAIAILPDQPIEPNRIYKTVAQGIMARTYLNLASVRTNGGNIGIEDCYSRTVEFCGDIIESGIHDLLPDYRDVFINQAVGSSDHTEIMWEVSYQYTTERNLGGPIGNHNGPKVGVKVNTDPEAVAWTAPSIKLQESYNDTLDTRYEWNIVNYQLRMNDAGQYSSSNIAVPLVWYCGKWRRVLRTEAVDGSFSYERLEPGILNRWNTSINFPLLRYADVLLMKSEALNALNGPTVEALEAINEVRARAGIGLVEDEITEAGEGLTQESLQKAIETERMRELCFEGHRRFDLVRWGFLVDNMKELNERMVNHPDYEQKFEYLTFGGDAAEEKHNVFPIPNDELNLNSNSTQHPLWE